MSSLIVLGSLNMDMVVRGERLPLPGETVRAEEFATTPGGKGANQAVAAARLGADVVMIGRVGDDAFGRELCAGLAAEGVDITMVETVPGISSGTATIAVDANGENMILVVAGANDRLQPADVDRVADELARASTLVLQLETPLAAVMRASELATGARVVLNAAPVRPLPAAFLARVEVLVVNCTEAARLTGRDVHDPADDLLAALAELGPELVVLTLGAKGVKARHGDATLVRDGFPVRCIDAVGAGDAFVAGLAVALDRGQSLADALELGCAAGALACTRDGAQRSMPSLAAVKAFLARD